MSRQAIFLGIACCLVVLSTFEAAAITRRHDVADSDYLHLAAEMSYATAGLVNAGTTCAVAGGALVHPEWVLTAAHCVPATTVGQTVKFSLGPDDSNLAITIDADDWFRHASFNGNVVHGNDLALIHLDTPVLDVTPGRLYRGSAELGSTVTAVSYGRTGTGQTGDTLPRGTRRAAENMVDRYGNAVGFSVDMLLTDFDNPVNPADSVWGSNAPLALEGAIALNDSGSPWYLAENGMNYIAAVSSFRSTADGSPNSDYRDVSAGMRVGQETAWLDANHDRTIFWDGSSANWNQDAAWVASPQPAGHNAVVIDRGAVALTDAAETAKFIFVDGTGRLEVANTVTTDHLLVRGQGTLAISGGIALSSDVTVDSGTIEFGIRGTTAASEYDQLTVNGTVTLDGALEVLINNSSGRYADPTVRGTVDEFVLLSATDLQGTLAAVGYDDSVIAEGSNYVGTNQDGTDGLFRILQYDADVSETVTLKNYLALPGDANGDLIVDLLDLNIWSNHRFETGATWLEGDFNHDGMSDLLDFNIWSAHRFTTAPIDTPEPTSLGLLMTIAVTVYLGRRRHGVR